MLGRRHFGMAFGAAVLAAPAIARAQKYPSGRVTIVVPFPAGAATDISARVYAEGLSGLWGQPVVIDNKGGGNGIPAAESVARAKPDGLTIFATSAMNFTPQKTMTSASVLAARRDRSSESPTKSARS